jgi:hypothetical protein
MNGKTQPSLYQIEHETLREYIHEHIEWSRATFEGGTHFEGLMKHIEKEVNEARDAYYNAAQEIVLAKEILVELVDIVILSIDAMWRLGFTPEQIARALIEKQNINKGRRYPKITDESQPTEHLRDR